VADYSKKLGEQPSKIDGVTFRIAVGELTASRASLVLAGELAHIVYSDPPWGPGNLMYWRTMNRERQRPSWDAFLGTFCDVAVASVRPGGHVFVEMGLRWVDQLAAAMSARGLREAGRWTVRYGSPLRPNVLWYSGPGAPCAPDGMSGEPMTSHVLASVATPGALVFDPCCGRGMTARCALRAGMRFAGVELNPDRAAVTRQWCERWMSRSGA
jgi:hypothetical protein